MNRTLPRRRALLAAALAVPGMLPAGAQAAEEPRLGVYKGAGCDGRPRLAEFGRWLGRTPGWAVDFLARENWAEIRNTAEWVTGCWRGAPQHLSLAVPLLPEEEPSSLAAGARGAHDTEFRFIARALVEGGRAGAVLRLGWEFNGDWYPWAAQRDPAGFIAYWRRVVGVMRQQPGAAFRFEWTPGLGADGLDPERAWPGREFVDVIGLHVYNQSWRVPAADQEGRWRELRDAPRGLDWHRRFAAAQDRPRSFAEWGTGRRTGGGGGGDDPVFIARMAAWVAAPDVLYHGYWDFPAPDYDGVISDGRQPQAARAFREAFGVARR
jgi:hypothetical protein